MPSSLSTLLIVALTGLILGVVAGLLLASLRGDSDEEVQPEQESPPGGRAGHYVPVLRLWREKSSEALIVEMDGKSYLSPDPLAVAQRENLEKAAGELIGWLGAVADLPGRAAAANRAVAGQPVPPADSPAAQVAQPAPVRTPASPSGPPVSPAAQGQRPTTEALNLPVVPAQAVKEAPKSIVGQIDVILQEMLDRSGLDNRGISLTEDPRKGVIVWIGLDHFDGIDAVTDAEIKGIIRAAVGEWERRQEQNVRH